MAMGTSDVLAPGRFRLLLGALCLFLVGTAATTSLRRALLVEFVLLAVTVVVAVLELRSRGQRWLGTIVLAGLVICLAPAGLTLPLRHVPLMAGTGLGIFARLRAPVGYTPL